MDTSWRERDDKTIPINRIIPFSAVDGPGNRTAVFVQGCNIDCKYCHNPETRAICVSCGECVATCPTKALRFDQDQRVIFDATKCIECDTCIHVCQYDASPRVIQMSALQVYDEIQKQAPFIRGVTVSGGECMLYPEFLTKLFTLCKQNGLTTLIDSNGMIALENYDSLLEVTDGVMLDIKAFLEEDSIKVTGFENQVVLKNLVLLAQRNKLEEIRTVIVPELFDAKELIRNVAILLRNSMELKKLRYKLITYRPNGVRKQYQGLCEPTTDYMKELERYAREQGLGTVVII